MLLNFYFELNLTQRFAPCRERCPLSVPMQWVLTPDSMFSTLQSVHNVSVRGSGLVIVWLHQKPYGSLLLGLQTIKQQSKVSRYLEYL